MNKITKADEEKILKILEGLGIDCWTSFSPLSYVDYLKNIMDKVFYYGHGASKLVLVLKDYPDFVVKIPFNGGHLDEDEMVCKVDNEEDMKEYYDKDYDMYFLPFEDAPYGKTIWDYCDTEETLYDYAVEEEVEDFFLPTIRIGYVNDYPIYIQEKAKPWEDLTDEEWGNVSEEALERGEEISHEQGRYCEIDYDWCAKVIDTIGEDKLMSLYSFCHNYEVTDLHNGNYGITTDDRPVIFDYSGFSDSCGESSPLQLR